MCAWVGAWARQMRADRRRHAFGNGSFQAVDGVGAGGQSQHRQFIDQPIKKAAKRIGGAGIEQSWENNPKSPTQPSHPQVSNKFEYFFSRRLKSVAGIRGPHPFGEVGKG